MPAKIPKNEIFDELQRLNRKLGRPPSASDVAEHGDISKGVITSRFESWAEARRQAGITGTIDPSARKRTPEWVLLHDLRELARDIGKIPAAGDMEEYGSRSPTTYQRRFGSWEEARKKAGFIEENSPKVSAQSLVDGIHELASELGRTPSKTEMDEVGEFAANTYDQRFGTYTTAIRKAGYAPIEKLSGERPPLWKGGVSGYGDGWTEEKRRKARARDNYTCQDPDCSMTQDRHNEVYDQKLHVHHIKPIRTFDDKERGNHMKNLVTLCLPCHRKWEQMAPLRPDTAGDVATGD